MISELSCSIHPQHQEADADSLGQALWLEPILSAASAQTQGQTPQGAVLCEDVCDGVPGIVCVCECACSYVDVYIC